MALDDSHGSDDLDSSETRLLLPPRSPPRPPQPLQRPTPPPPQPPPETELMPVERLALRIKTVTDAKEHPLDVDPEATIAELKSQVARTIKAEGKFLRLIVQGKILAPDNATISSFKVGDRAFIHAVVSERPPQSRPAAPLGEDEVIEYPEAEEDPATRRGFDRLRNRGFTLQEVAAIRSYFGPQVAAYATLAPVVEGEEDLDRRYRMEEEWMGRQGETSEFAMNTADRESGRISASRLVPYRSTAEMEYRQQAHDANIGSSREFMWGFIMGFALGFICLFWLWNIPMSHQQKMGILAGVSCQLGWSIIRKQTWENREGGGEGEE